MKNEIKPDLISRRKAFSLLGLIAFSAAALPAILAATNADAQTHGMERRDERRDVRDERRTERRTKKKKKKKTKQAM